MKMQISTARRQECQANQAAVRAAPQVAVPGQRVVVEVVVTVTVPTVAWLPAGPQTVTVCTGGGTKPDPCGGVFGDVD